jgi:hypothetical protein
MSQFTAGPKENDRYIYKEQLSFITIGHGADVYTNIQLAEKYSCDPGDDTYDMPFYIRSKCDSSSVQGPRHEDREARPKGIAFFVHQRMPCSAFLAWIANSMRHVVARWQGAIVAVDKEFKPNSDRHFTATSIAFFLMIRVFPSPRGKSMLHRRTKSSRRNRARQYPSGKNSKRSHSANLMIDS